MAGHEAPWIPSSFSFYSYSPPPLSTYNNIQGVPKKAWDLDDDIVHLRKSIRTFNLNENLKIDLMLVKLYWILKPEQSFSSYKSAYIKERNRDISCFLGLPVYWQSIYLFLIQSRLHSNQSYPCISRNVISSYGFIY